MRHLRQWRPLLSVVVLVRAYTYINFFRSYNTGLTFNASPKENTDPDMIIPGRLGCLAYYVDVRCDRLGATLCIRPSEV